MLGDILAISNMLGLSVGQLVAMGGLTAAAVGIKSYSGISNMMQQYKVDQYAKFKDKKQQLEIDSYDEHLEKEKKQIEHDLELIRLASKEREIKEHRLIEATVDKVMYKGIKPQNKQDLLLGYNADYLPVWGSDTNYIIAGCTGAGKTRFLYALLLNYLANRQGICYIADLKGIDFKLFNGCKGVACYVDELQDVFQVIVAFQAEYEARKELFQADGYIDINDYNTHNPDKQLKQFLLLIDEFADIADVYSKNKKPIGAYAILIEMARKCRAYGGRIILGTQRPSADVIIGTLKANCSLIGLKTKNELNSKIIIDESGCERLAKGEALTYINGDMIKLFSYWISDQGLKRCTDKLK